jgi:hypothetical protein
MAGGASCTFTGTRASLPIARLAHRNPTAISLDRGTANDRALPVVCIIKPGTMSPHHTVAKRVETAFILKAFRRFAQF